MYEPSVCSNVNLSLNVLPQMGKILGKRTAPLKQPFAKGLPNGSPLEGVGINLNIVCQSFVQRINFA